MNPFPFIAKVLVAPLILMLSWTGYGVAPSNQIAQLSGANNVGSFSYTDIDGKTRTYIVENPTGKDTKEGVKIVPKGILGAYNPTGGGTYRLQSSIGSSDTSLTLSTFKEPISGIKYTMTYLNSSIEYATLEPTSSTNKEFISFTGITQNTDNTATLTGVTRGLGFSYPYTASTTLQKTHSGQTILILSNPPQLTNQYANKNNDETILGGWNFASAIPTVTLTATTSHQVVTKGYADAIANQGAATSTETNGGIVELGTLAEQAAAFDGGASKPTVLQTKNASSTCPGVSTTVIAASSTTGKIDRSCIDQTSAYTYTGPITFGTATTTFNATTTIAASTSTAPIILNGAKYAFPAGTGNGINTGASSTVLTTNGSGQLSWAVTDWTRATTTAFSGVATTSVINVPAKRGIWIYYESFGMNNSYIQFNGDSGANHSSNVFAQSSGTPTAITQKGGIGPLDSGNVRCTAWIFISNPSGDVKTIDWKATCKNGNNPPNDREGYGVYLSNTQVTTFTIGAWGGGSLGQSVVDVYVSRD